MSYLEDKLGVKYTDEIKDYLLSGGFTPYSGNFTDKLIYFAQRGTKNLSIIANIDEKTLSYSVYYRHGRGTIYSDTLNYTDVLSDFEEEYKTFVDEASCWFK